MKPAAYELALFLQSQGVGTLGTDIHVGTEPELPDECVTLYDTGGGEPDTDEMDIRRPTVMIKVRSKNYLTAHERQEQIQQLFFNSLRIVTQWSRFSGVILSSDFISIGQDDSKRHAFTANYRCIRSAL